MMKIGQNMTKFDENQWYWVQKYDFMVKQMIFIMIWGSNMQNLIQKWNFEKMLKIFEILFCSKTIFNQEFDFVGQKPKK